MSERPTIDHPFNLEAFVKAKDSMIATSTDAYKNLYNDYFENNYLSSNHFKKYSPEELANVINSDSLTTLQQASEYFYNTNGYYQQFINYYATLLKYVGVLIPNANGKSLSASHVVKRYNQAMDYVEEMNLPVWLSHCARRALIYGTYYGLRIDSDKRKFNVIDLSTQYCKNVLRDAEGNDVIQFNVRYFDTITDAQAKDQLIKLFPKEVRTHYDKYKKGLTKTKWAVIPVANGICFTLFDGRPFLLKVVPAILDYDESVTLEHAKDRANIEKVLVQHIPHLQDGRLLFEPDEAEEMHDGAVGMLKSAKSVRVLTTYADVSSVQSNAETDDVDEKLNRLEQNIYAKAGLSGQIFAPTGSASLEVAQNNDLALMMQLANKFALYITTLLNTQFGNTNVRFKYNILPISYYNARSMIEDSFKLVTSGYSLLVPALAFGMSQKDLVGIKDLENDILKLNDKLVPLSTSYTQTSARQGDTQDDKADQGSNEDKAVQDGKVKQAVDQGGRPELDQQKKSDKTIKNEEARD